MNSAVANKRRAWWPILLTLAVPVAALVGALAYRDLAAYHHAEFSVRHTYQVLSAADRIQAGVESAVANQRGYLLTENGTLLAAYKKAAKKALSAENDLRRLTEDNPGQGQYLNQLRLLLEARFDALGRTTAVRQKSGLAAVPEAIRTGDGQVLDVELHNLLAQVRQQEESLLRSRSAAMDRQAERTVAGVVMGTTALCGLLALAALLLRGDRVRRLRVERELLESENNFRHLADAMPQIVWTAGADGSTNYYNRRWYEYTGKTFEQSKDWGWEDVLHPDDLHVCIQRWTRSFTTGSYYEMETRFRRAADGTYRWHLVRAIPTRNQLGEVTQWFGTCTDIEDYKRAAAAVQSLNEELENRVQQRTGELERAIGELTDTRAQLQAVLDAATQVSIISTDAAGSIRLFNSGAERMLGYAASEMLGQTPEKIHKQSEIEERSASLSRAMGKPVTGMEVFFVEALRGHSDEREWTYIRKDGSTLDVRLAVTAVHDSHGNIGGFLGVASDITDLKRLERQLRLNNDELVEQTRKAEEANRAKSEFLASMSHEIRTPMNSIVGIADLLWDSELDPEQRQYVEVFRRAGTNLLALINDILDVSKIEAGHFELEQVEFDLEEAIDETIDLIRPRARAKGILLLSRLSPRLTTRVIGDPTRLRQVLINLLGNAVKFTNKGEVVLAAANSVSGIPGHIDFAVSDTGIGIPAQKLDSIFDDFTQADSSTTRQYGGTGLGLAISRRVVERMGGNLSVSSEPGMGSTFRFTSAFQPGSSVEERLPAEVNDLYGKCVLVVDDNVTNRLILRETLSMWGVVAHECATAGEALAALHRQCYAAVILDNRMPGMSGLDLAAEIKAGACISPLILLTSDVNPGDQAKRRQLGLAGYAVKPVKRSELLHLLCSALKVERSAAPAELVSGTSCVEYRPKSPTLKILVAEDAADNRLLVKAYMKGTAHSLSFVEDGQSAVEAYSADNTFDLILMDIRMPVMDGLAATRAIRAVEREHGWSRVPVIALTADARPQDMQLSREAGCCAHLSKPISKKKLLTAIEDYGHIRQPMAPRAEPLTINLPEGLEDLVPDYVEGRKIELAEMISLLAASDFDRLRSIGHNLKGSGASYGFPDLTTYGGDLESAARQSDRARVARQISAIGEYLAALDHAVYV